MLKENRCKRGRKKEISWMCGCICTQVKQETERSQCSNQQHPGHLRVLSQQEQEGLGVDKQSPARQAEEQQDQNAPLQDHPHMQQILTPKRLQDKTGKSFVTRGMRMTSHYSF